MGRGIWYYNSHPHGMMVEEDSFLLKTYTDADGNEVELKEPEWDRQAFEMFEEDVIGAFGGYADEDQIDREARVFGATDRLVFGIDTSGDGMFLFVRPKTYEHPLTREEKDYVIDKEVRRALNKLIKLWPNTFRVPTSAWTSSQVLTAYPR